MLRNEHLAITARANRFAPDVLAWLDTPHQDPVLVTECLEGHWPASRVGVHWRPGDLRRVFLALRELSTLPAPTGLLAGRADLRSMQWRSLRAVPDSFLALNLCSAAWFDRHAQALARAEEGLDQSGSSFVHGDIRSDNICILRDRVCFVDWSGATAGGAEYDLAGFLPTAHLEGGPAPGVVLPDGGAWAAMQSGDLIARAMATGSGAPAWLQRVFRRLAVINLDWAAESLGLAPRDGPAWQDL